MRSRRARAGVAADVDATGQPQVTPSPADSGPVPGRGQRPLWQPIVVVVVLTVAVLLTSLLVTGRLTGRGHRPPGRVPVVAASSSSPAHSASPSGTVGDVAPVAGTHVVFAFDDGLPPTLAARTAEGGQVTLVAHGAGKAVAFPPPCAHYEGPECPRVALEAPDSAGLNPGSHDLTWGAALLIAPNQTTPGSNIVQKGSSVGGRGQFKLQVDGFAGHPSCVLTNTGSTGPIYVAKAAASVADSRWHAVRCARHGASLTVSIDGVESGRTTVPESLSVVNDETVRIGGKGASPNNDQFAGTLDDVFIDIES
jgi:hypothetical protein